MNLGDKKMVTPVKKSGEIYQDQFNVIRDAGSDASKAFDSAVKVINDKRNKLDAGFAIGVNTAVGIAGKGIRKIGLKDQGQFIEKFASDNMDNVAKARKLTPKAIKNSKSAQAGKFAGVALGAGGVVIVGTLVTGVCVALAP